MSPPRTERSGPPPQGPAPEISFRQVTNPPHNGTAHGATLPPVPGLLVPLDDPLTRAEIGRVVGPLLAEARRELGYVVAIESAEWWRASDTTKLGGILALALAWAVNDPHRAAAEALKAASADVSRDAGWVAASRRPTLDTLSARRAQPGPMLRHVDPAAAARWAATGAG